MRTITFFNFLNPLIVQYRFPKGNVTLFCSPTGPLCYPCETVRGWQGRIVLYEVMITFFVPQGVTKGARLETV